MKREKQWVRVALEITNHTLLPKAMQIIYHDPSLKKISLCVAMGGVYSCLGFKDSTIINRR